MSIKRKNVTVLMILVINMNRKSTREEKAKYWKAQIESLIKYELGSNQSKFLQQLVKEYNWSSSRSSFSTRLSKGSLTLVELSEILEICNKKSPKLYE